MEAKRSFIIYDDVMDALEMIGDKAKAFDAIRAMRAYSNALANGGGFDEQEYLSDPMVRIVFTMGSSAIRQNHIKWLQSCLRNRRNRIASELKRNGRAATEEDVRAHLLVVGELDSYLETVRYVHALEALPSGKLMPDPSPVVTSRHQSSPVVTDMDMDMDMDMEGVTGTESDFEPDTENEKGYGGGIGRGFGGNQGGNRPGGSPLIRCPSCGIERAATIDPDGSLRGWCPQCKIEITE